MRYHETPFRFDLWSRCLWSCLAWSLCWLVRSRTKRPDWAFPPRSSSTQGEDLLHPLLSWLSVQTSRHLWRFIDRPDDDGEKEVAKLIFHYRVLQKEDEKFGDGHDTPMSHHLNGTLLYRFPRDPREDRGHEKVFRSIVVASAFTADAVIRPIKWGRY